MEFVLSLPWGLRRWPICGLCDIPFNWLWRTWRASLRTTKFFHPSELLEMSRSWVCLFSKDSIKFNKFPRLREVEPFAQLMLSTVGVKSWVCFGGWKKWSRSGRKRLCSSISSRTSQQLDTAGFESVLQVVWAFPFAATTFHFLLFEHGMFGCLVTFICFQR